MIQMVPFHQVPLELTLQYFRVATKERTYRSQIDKPLCFPIVIWKGVCAADQLPPLVFPFKCANDSMISTTLTCFPDNILYQLIQENPLIDSAVDMTQTKTLSVSGGLLVL